MFENSISKSQNTPKEISNITAEILNVNEITLRPFFIGSIVV